MVHSDYESGWWEATFSQQTTVRSVLVIGRDNCCPERNVFQISIGNLRPPSQNPVCVSFNVESGAYQCPNAMTGLCLGIFR